MLEIALGILKKWWPQIVGAVLVVALVVGVFMWDRGRLADARNEGRAEVQAEFDAYKTKQQQMVTALALMWAEAIQKVEVRYVQQTEERSRVFAWHRERAGKIRAATDAVSVRVPPDALGLLNDAHRAANDPRPAGVDQVPAAPVPESARDTTLTEWVQFAIDAAEAYRDAADKHSACVEFVGRIRQANLSQTETTP